MASSTRPIDSALGTQVRHARRERGMSQAILATQLGVSIHQVQAYETGHDRINARSLINVARALQKDISYFFSGRPAGAVDRADRSRSVAVSDTPGSTDSDHGLSIMQLLACIEHENPDFKERLYDIMMSLSGRSLRNGHAKTLPATPRPLVKTGALD